MVSLLCSTLALFQANWHVLSIDWATYKPIHLNHERDFGKGVPKINLAVLKAVDTVQKKFPDGGGYFVGVKAVPAESPIGYPLSLFDTKLLEPPRSTSYCSGSSYTVFIEALNLIFARRAPALTPAQKEAMRMQEPDGGRREDGVKFWGWWNADGPGSQFALVQFSGMGEHVAPQDALPGDFMNISWKSGLGHSVVFLGWAKNAAGEPGVLFWSSQKSTNGLSDSFATLDRIKEVLIVRLTHPERISKLNPDTKVDLKAPYDLIDWKGL